MIVPAIVSALLLWASFFPLNLGPLAFVALVPWLALVRAPGPNRRRYLAAYLGGFIFFLAALQWVRVAHPMMYFSWLALALVCPLFWVLGLFLIRRLDRLRFVPLALSVPVVWVALEYMRAHFPTGFPFLEPLGLYQMVGFGWYFLGYTQHDFTPLVQVADLGGVYAVTFLVAAVNGLLAEWLMRSGVVRRWRAWEALPRPSLARTLGTMAAVGLLFAGALAYGYAKLDHAAFAEGPRVAALQGSVPQMVKVQRGRGLVETYRALYDEALNQRVRPDLILWPETCCPIDWYEPLPPQHRESAPPDYRDGLRFSQNLTDSRPPVSVLLGLNAYDWDGQREWKYNSAVMLAAGGEYVGRYDKMHLVPFGEYVPFKDTLPFMAWFTPYKHDYSCRPGERWTRFPLEANGRRYTFGCLICYEDSDPYLARQYVATQPVDFLVNISNDGWFNGTEEHEQHLAICRFRAIEARRAVVRSVNMGISGVIDGDGRIGALLKEGPWSASKQSEGVMQAVVPLDERRSWYARVGDALPAACWAVMALGVALACARRAGHA